MEGTKYDIKHAFGHYELYKNGKFFGSYDTATEAANAIDEDRIFWPGGITKPSILHSGLIKQVTDID